MVSRVDVIWLYAVYKSALKDGTDRKIRKLAIKMNAFFGRYVITTISEVHAL